MLHEPELPKSESLTLDVAATRRFAGVVVPSWIFSIARSRAFIIGVPVLVAGLLCAYKLGSRSIWLDEAATISITHQSGAALWSGIARDGGNMLAYYLLLHVLIGAFGDVTAVIRFPSVIANALTAGLVVLIGLRLFFDRRIAFLAGLLVGISLPLIYWGQNARGYALMVTFATAAFLAFLEMVRADGSGTVGMRADEAGGSGRRVSRGHVAVIAYVVCTVIALYIGFDAVLLMTAQGAIILVAYRERLRLFIVSAVVIVVCCVPLVVLAVERGPGQLFWVPPLNLKVLWQAIVTLFSAGMPPDFERSITSTPLAILSLLLLIFAVVKSVRLARRHGIGPTTVPQLICAAWVVVPSVIGLLAAAAGQPIELARCTVLLMPGLALLFAWALTRPGPPPGTPRWTLRGPGRLLARPRQVLATRPRLAHWLGVAGVVLMLVLRLLQAQPTYGHSPEDWKAATTYIVAVNRDESACLMFYPQDARMPFDYYVRHEGIRTARRLKAVFPAGPWDSIKPYVEEYRIPSKPRLQQIVDRCPRLWLISSHEGQNNGPKLSGRNYRKYERLVAELGWVYPSQNLVQFGHAATIYDWQLSRPANEQPEQMGHPGGY